MPHQRQLDRRACAVRHCSATASTSSSANCSPRPPNPRSSAAACRNCSRASTSRGASWPSANTRPTSCATKPPRRRRSRPTSARSLPKPRSAAGRPTETLTHRKERCSKTSFGSRTKSAASCSARSRQCGAMRKLRGRPSGWKTRCMRERINDVAAEVARLTSVLEGPGNPDRRDPCRRHRRAHDLAQQRRGERQWPRIAGQRRKRKGTLADRIRALQSRASRVPQPSGAA